jgi:hypothetical protein
LTVINTIFTADLIDEGASFQTEPGVERAARAENTGMNGPAITAAGLPTKAVVLLQNKDLTAFTGNLGSDSQANYSGSDNNNIYITRHKAFLTQG